MPRSDHRWPEDLERQLINGWYRGKQIKQLSHELGKTPSSIKNKRKQLGLPPRRTADKDYQLRVNVNEELYRKIRRRCLERQQPVTHYLRHLIIRDVGMNP